MACPFDQLNALARANLDLSFRLADITRRASQGSAQTAGEVIVTLSEAALREISPGNKAAALSDKSVYLYRETENLRDQVLADTRAAFETWRDAWQATAVAPNETKATEAFNNLLRFWQNLGLGTPTTTKAK